jgi:CBS domain-containing protein
MSFVKDIMKSKIVTVSHDETIKNACQKYKDFKIGCLIVLDNDNIVGLVTERDIIERTILLDKDPNTAKIRDIMTTDLITIDMDEKVMKAVDVMKDNNIKKLPVTHKGSLIGIVTSTDIAYSRPSLKHFLRDE